MRLMTSILLATTLIHSAAAEGTPGSPSETNPPVAEIVTFRLVAGTEPADFIAAADKLGPFLRNTGALVHRTLTVDDTGLWTDHILWTSAQAAQTASTQMFDRPEARPFIAMIAPDDMVMRHAPVQLQQE
jgi:hypothetical protein